MINQITHDVVMSITADVRAFMEGEKEYHRMSDGAQEVLYEAFYMEMPIGVANGDDGTPDEWFDHLDTEEVINGVVNHLHYLDRKGLKIYGKV